MLGELLEMNLAGSRSGEGLESLLIRPAYGKPEL